MESLKKIFRLIDRFIGRVLTYFAAPVLPFFLFSEIGTMYVSPYVVVVAFILIVFSIIVLPIGWKYAKDNGQQHVFYLRVVFFVDGAHSVHLFHTENTITWYLAYLLFLVTFACLGHELNKPTSNLDKPTNSKENAKRKLLEICICLGFMAIGFVVAHWVDRVDKNYSKHKLEQNQFPTH